MPHVILAKLEPVEEINGYAPPFDILFLADALEKSGFSVRVFHEAGTRRAIKELVDTVVAEEPLSVTTLGSPISNRLFEDKREFP